MEKVNICELVFTGNAILTKSKKNLQENLKIWNKMMLENVMMINYNKTKVMIILKEKARQNLI